jgi:hypothetical protein
MPAKHSSSKRHLLIFLIASHMGLSADLHFIVSTNTQKADPETRKLIRSHVMQGKNRMKSRRRPRDSVSENKAETESLMVYNPVWTSNIPRLLCSELSAIPFADTVELGLIADALSCEL